MHIYGAGIHQEALSKREVWLGDKCTSRKHSYCFSQVVGIPLTGCQYIINHLHSRLAMQYPTLGLPFLLFFIPGPWSSGWGLKVLKELKIDQYCVERRSTRRLLSPWHWLAFTVRSAPIAFANVIFLVRPKEHWLRMLFHTSSSIRFRWDSGGAGGYGSLISTDKMKRDLFIMLPNLSNQSVCTYLPSWWYSVGM